MIKRFVSLLLAIVLASVPMLAFAEPDDEAQDQPTEESEEGMSEEELRISLDNDMLLQFNIWQDEVDEANTVYEESLAKHDELVSQIEATRAELEHIRKSIAENQKVISDRMVEDYKTQDTNAVLSFFLDSTSFDELLHKVDYAERLYIPFNNAVKENKVLQEQESATLQNLEAMEAESAQALAESEEAKARVDEVSDMLQKKISGELGLYEAPSVPIEGYESAIQAGASRLGLPYVWGGGGEDNISFDCSGLTSWCYRKAYGVNIGRTTADQLANADKVLPISEAKPGDILFRYAADGSVAYQHVAIYLGQFGTMQKAYIHAPRTGRLTCIQDGADTFDLVLRFSCSGN